MVLVLHIDVLKLLHKYKEYDIFKRKVIKPFLKLATVKVDKNLVIISTQLIEAGVDIDVDIIIRDCFC